MTVRFVLEVVVEPRQAITKPRNCLVLGLPVELLLAGT